MQHDEGGQTSGWRSSFLKAPAGETHLWRGHPSIVPLIAWQEFFFASSLKPTVDDLQKPLSCFPPVRFVTVGSLCKGHSYVAGGLSSGVMFAQQSCACVCVCVSSLNRESSQAGPLLANMNGQLWTRSTAWSFSFFFFFFISRNWIVHRGLSPVFFFFCATFVI